jgi:hypothetical protein
MPHVGHLPGLLLTTSGCIGHVYFAFAIVFVFAVVVFVVVVLLLLVCAKMENVVNDAIKRRISVFI